jgi:hypothetical protein
MKCPVEKNGSRNAPHLILVNCETVTYGRVWIVETVWLGWYGPFRFSAINNYDNRCLDSDAGVYIFLDSERSENGWGNYDLLYVGMVYGRTFRKRVPEHAIGNGDEPWHWVQGNLEGELTVKVASMILEEGRNITESLVRDIENLLLFRLDPPANVQGVETYTGRELTIINERRFNPLPRHVNSP